MNTCSHCGNDFEGKFCNECGQKLYTAADKSLWNIIKDAFHFITHFEGSFLNSLKTILRRPGKMSLDYCDGIRKPYFRPISLYLLIVIIYLLSPFARGLNMSLQLHSRHAFYGKIASDQISAKVAAIGKNMDYLAAKYAGTSEKVSKILLLILIPLTALLLRLLFIWKKKLWFDFFILAIEINVLYILLFFFLVPILFQLISLVVPSFFEIIGNEDNTLAPLLLLFATFIYFMFRRFFGARWYAILPLALAFPLLFFLLDQLVYRFLLFEISFAWV